MTLLVGSANAAIGFPAAWDILTTGGWALDAVVAAIAVVEADPGDHSVGLGGLPNLLGDVELDASLMDGTTLAAGGVAALRGYQDAITLARGVIEHLPHVLLAGAGTGRFAEEIGLHPVDLLTAESERIWQERLDATTAKDAAYLARMRDLAAHLTRDPERPDDAHGTVNVIARDDAGRLACGVSTSGWAWKFPGRVGDSPIIGAGNYADDRFGAAACTGRGEMALRLCTAHTVVMAMRCGASLDDALDLAAHDLHALPDPYASEVNVVAVDHAGNHAAVSTVPGKTYVFQTPETDGPQERERRYVPPPAEAP